MPVVVTVDDLTTVESAPIFTGTCDTDYSDIELTINGDVYKTRSLSGKWRIPTNPVSRELIELVPQGTGIDAYGAEPVAIRLNDNRILLMYWKGGGHLSDDGRLIGQYSDTEGVSWSSPFVIADHSSGYDTRNAVIYYNATDNRIALFYRTYNDALSQHVDAWFQTSTDYGQTWSAPVSMTTWVPNLSGIVAPFGPAVETTNGAMTTFYDISGNCVALFSTDNGATWGNEKVIFSGQLDFNETSVIAVDTSRLVAVIRTQAAYDSYHYATSSDGGLTWSAPSIAYKYIDTFVPSAPSPLTGITVGDDIIVAFTPRYKTLDPGRVITNRLNKEEFWSNPEKAWSTTAPLRKEEFFSVQTNALDFGYPRLLPILDGDYTALMWFYEQGTTSDTSKIMQSTISRI